MQIIESNIVKEKLYIEKLENGLEILLMPKKEIQKKFVIWATKYGSIDSEFIIPNEAEITKVPDGIAHFLEHKLFEQENGTNSLDVLSTLGANPNAYTTADHTAYHIETIDNFELCLDEFMDYVQNPYFTDENVEKEKGIIGQEITMYDDHPSWQVYLNALKCLYKNNPIRIDTAGTIETISGINKEILYKCYNTFYHPSNMVLFIAGNFEPEDMLKEIKNRIIKTENQGEIKRIYPDEPKDTNKKIIEKKMDINIPLFTFAYKDVPPDNNMVKRHIGIQILLNMIIGKSTKTYNELYEQGLLLIEPDTEYEFNKNYAYCMISGQSKDPNKVLETLKNKIKNLKENELDKEHFERIKKMIYGEYIKEYNSIGDIGRMFVSGRLKGINAFDYLDNFEQITIQYIKQILNELFVEEKLGVSIVWNK